MPSQSALLPKPARDEQLFKLLADGDIHSTASVASAFGGETPPLETLAVLLGSYGVEIEVAGDDRLRLKHPIELLQADRIVAALERSGSAPRRIDLAFSIDSTNQALMERAGREDTHRHVCLAEFQRMGRGRRGKAWIAPLGSGLCMSVAWDLRVAPEILLSLGLTMATVAVRVLRNLGINDVGIKWPNDIWWKNRKLGGILVETRVGPHNKHTAVAGIGINVALPQRRLREIEQPYTDIQTALGRGVSRNALATALLDELHTAFTIFERFGFAPFYNECLGYDVVYGQKVQLSWRGTRLVGRAFGIDPRGALSLEMEDSTCRFEAGDLSLRPAD
ncbi:MAG: biotin--[acetyl-CoA-carboxylase] ligase [Gammaproteobacteria bacterium]